MNRTIITFVSLTGLLLTAGCPGDDSMMMETTATTTTTGTTSTGPDPDSTGGTTMEPTTMTEESTDSTGEGPGFMFEDAPPDDYTRVDRMGMPAINTAVISSKDNYNAASPEDDANGDFVDEIVANVTGLHDALDDDLMGAGLVPCMPMDCVNQAAPLVVPDTIKIDLSGTAGFPNGRLPTDPVIDVTLAVVLLDLTEPGQDPLSLVGVNPTENDVAFSDEFPFFAPPHQ
ncbi:DUF4331 family protein [Paraliomyxa miuraensis]|uniref:DUF4331 family protein n=1 Tax=Paraliomyxa miuraensis TaxID=376150 RepID=UPI002254E895|nr:DUF4331 family protein [Paraliomyxa miuraensis]MCX4244507.1 DUF4331 domain-containing protein [Paraliomyxa miuraensis]